MDYTAVNATATSEAGAQQFARSKLWVMPRNQIYLQAPLNQTKPLLEQLRRKKVLMSWFISKTILLFFTQVWLLYLGKLHISLEKIKWKPESYWRITELVFMCLNIPVKTWNSLGVCVEIYYWYPIGSIHRLPGFKALIIKPDFYTDCHLSNLLRRLKTWNNFWGRNNLLPCPPLIVVK